MKSKRSRRLWPSKSSPKRQSKKRKLSRRDRLSCSNRMTKIQTTKRSNKWSTKSVAMRAMMLTRMKSSALIQMMPMKQKKTLLIRLLKRKLQQLRKLTKLKIIQTLMRVMTKMKKMRRNKRRRELSLSQCKRNLMPLKQFWYRQRDALSVQSQYVIMLIGHLLERLHASLTILNMKKIIALSIFSKIALSGKKGQFCDNSKKEKSITIQNSTS